MLHCQRSMLKTLHFMRVNACSCNQGITSNLVGAATVVLGSNTWRPKTLRLKSPIFLLPSSPFDGQIVCLSLFLRMRRWHLAAPQWYETNGRSADVGSFVGENIAWGKHMDRCKGVRVCVCRGCQNYAI